MSIDSPQTLYSLENFQGKIKSAVTLKLFVNPCPVYIYGFTQILNQIIGHRNG